MGLLSQELPCVKRVEDALLVYQGITSSSRRDKRRRLNVPYQLVLNGGVGENDNAEQDPWNQLVSQSVAGNDETEYVVWNELDLWRSNDDHETAESNNNHSKARQETEQDQKAIEILTKKIQKGIEMKTSRKKRKRASNQLQIQSGATAVVVSEFDTWFAANQTDGIEDKSLRLETLLWTRASDLVETAQEVAWKYRFIASCLHILRIGDKSDHQQRYGVGVWRWARAARVVNAIVDKLWGAWGPKASLVYEALAVKNYILSDTSSISESRQQVIIDAVVVKLSRNPPPEVPPDTFVLHPAACISAAMKMEYRNVCRGLQLTGFSELGSVDVLNIQVQVSALLHQWKQVIAELGNDRSHGERAASHTSPFDILTAVAIAQINSPSLETTTVESTMDADLMDHRRGVTGDPVYRGAAEDSAVGDASQEQLIRKDLLPQTSGLSTFNAENSWDIPELPPLFSAEDHFDVFATP
ncbi:hypothetical protein IFR05_014257 [Cadophora sp. M221]|nr:hypothetical protein IFR05_014257 [Cadophora sp. M221]